jgi:serine/threonine-protein kinase
VYDSDRDTMTRLSSNPEQAVNFRPVWTPDGRYVLFCSMGSGVFWTRADGAGRSQLLFGGKPLQWPTSVAPDARTLAFNQVDGLPQLWSMDLSVESGGVKAGAATQFLGDKYEALEPVFSPDGRWLAYQSNESGRFEVYVRPFAPAASGRQYRLQISNNGGLQPVWMPGGRELLYYLNGQVMAVEYAVRGDELVAGKPRVWVSDVTGSGGFDVSPDGKRIAILLPASQDGRPAQDRTVVLLQNFLDELRRRAPIQP